MSSFTNALVVRMGDKPGIVEIMEDFRYYIGSLDSHEYVEVKKGRKTDLATCLPKGQLYDQPAAVHDELYRDGGYHIELEPGIPVFVRCSRKKADKIFLEAMLVKGVNKFKAHFFYRVLRSIGWYRWNEARKRDGNL